MSDVTFETAREAARSLPSEPPPVTDVIAYRDDGAVRLNDAADDLTALRGRDSDSRALSISADFAAAVDQLRSDWVQVDEFPDKSAQAVAVPAPAPKAAPVDVVTQALAIPAVQAEISAQISEVDALREQYGAGLSNTMAFSQAALHVIAPWFADIPNDQFLPAMAHLQRVDPGRYLQIINMLEHVGRIKAAQSAHETVTEVNRATWAKNESARFDQAVPLNPQEKKAVAAEMFEYAAELGISKQNLVHLMRTEPVLQSAEFQRVMFDAVRGRINEKRAANWRSSRARPEVPSVQRPGVSVGRSECSAANLGTLNAQLAQSGNLKDAFALLQAKRKN
jgi:hypothetical protein